MGHHLLHGDSGEFPGLVSESRFDRGIDAQLELGTKPFQIRIQLMAKAGEPGQLLGFATQASGVVPQGCPHTRHQVLAQVGFDAGTSEYVEWDPHVCIQRTTQNYNYFHFLGRNPPKFNP